MFAAPEFGLMKNDKFNMESTLPGTANTGFIPCRQWLLPFLLTVVAMSVLTACQPAPQSLLLQGQIMGTSYSVRVVQPAGAGNLQDEKALHQHVLARLEALDAALSTWIDSSDVSRFNRAPAGEWFAVGRDVLAIVSTAEAISAQTGGAFDITVGPLVDLWGFGPNGQPEHAPSVDEIASLKASTGYRQLEYRTEPPALKKAHPDLRIDLSAIAKGYAVDEIALLLHQLGYKNFMVEIGGEVITRGVRPDGTPWRIALERPLIGAREVLRVIPLSDRAMASSGDYRNYFEMDGRRFAHTIDPRTGWPVEHGLAAASVIADNCMAADAWATAFMVLGVRAGEDLARELGLAVNLVTPTGEGFEERMSEAYEKQIAEWSE